MRRCGRCEEEKPVEEFAWRRRARGQRDNYCRPCRVEYHREHYLANKPRYIAQARQRKKALLEERTQYLVAFFREHPCVDCGEADPVVLEFDHLREKKFSISEGVQGRRWQDVLDEIAKCEVVCANCHRRRTAKRGGFIRAAVAQW
jgi:ferredoxin